MRKKCYVPNCKEEWVIYLKIYIGDFGASESTEGKFCIIHARESRERYVERFNNELDRLLKMHESVKLAGKQKGDRNG